MTGQLYRAWVRVPLPYVKSIRASYGEAGQKVLLADVRARLLRLGFSETLLATQDPTNSEILTVLARRGSGPIGTDGVIHFLGSEPVEEPPKAALAATLPAFDHGLAADETMALEKSILHDQNARHLAGLASTLEPSFPAAASVLRAKSDLIEKRVLMNEANSRRLVERAFQRPLPDQEKRIASARAAFEADAVRSNIPLPVLRDGVRRAAIALLDDKNDPLQGHPASVQNLARVLVTDHVEFSVDGKRTDHLTLILPKAIALGLPPNEDDGFISPSALQLALAQQKPEWSKVSSAGKVQSVIDTIEKQAKVQSKSFRDILRARNQIERAVKGIDRRRWVEWYRRQSYLNAARGSCPRARF